MPEASTQGLRPGGTFGLEVITKRSTCFLVLMYNDATRMCRIAYLLFICAGPERLDGYRTPFNPFTPEPRNPDMAQGYAELQMYVAPDRVRDAQEQWLNAALALLGAERLDASALDLPQLWLSPRLLIAQTCGYPLMTQLRGQVQVVGRPVYQLPHSADGNHCSVLVARADDPRQRLEDFRGSHGLLNSQDSNSGMNLFRHALAPLHAGGAFFARVSLTGGHRNSLAEIKAKRGDLASIDSVTFDYLARDHSDEVAGLKVIARTAAGPCLPYITRVGADAQAILDALNQALQALPEVAQVLAIREVLPASEADYQVLLDYEQHARAQGLPTL